MEKTEGMSMEPPTIKAAATTTGDNAKGPKINRLMDSVKKTLYVMGSALFVFAAARNSFHWHIHQLWGASGSLWQSYWQYLYDRWGTDNHFYFSFAAIFGVTTLVFWLANAFFLIVEATGLPQSMKKYKIQEEVKVEMPKLKKALRVVLFNNIIIGIPFSAFTAYMYLLRGCSLDEELPTFAWVLIEILVFSLVEEFGFYYTHRLLHHPRLYKHIHKTHHEWTAPIGIISIYAHPVEHLVSNILPPALGPFLMRSHLATALLWFSLALMSTTIAHCGYHLPLLPSPEAHDYHHLKFNQNFGVLGVLDRLHGTDLQFRKSKQYERHVMLLSLTPLSQQYPTTPNKKAE